MKPTDTDLAWKAHAEKMAELNALIDASETIQAQIERASLELEALAEAAVSTLPFSFDFVYCQEKRCQENPLAPCLGCCLLHPEQSLPGFAPSGNAARSG